MSDCLFCKIIAGEIPSGIVYETDDLLAFKDINPQAPHHVLLIPKRHIERLSEVKPEDAGILGKLLAAVPEVCAKLGIEDAFRLVINDGESAGQSVFHLHAHLLSGRPFRWPPG